MTESTFAHRFTCAQPALDLRIRSVVTSDGRILERRCVADGPRGDPALGQLAAGPYAIADVAVTVPDGATAPLVWACESHTDLLARRLGFDPFDLRRRNLDPDDFSVAALEALQARMGWRGPFDRSHGVLRRGRGVALDVTAASPRAVGAEVAVDLEDGAVRVTRLVVADASGAERATADDLALDGLQVIDAALAGTAIPGLDDAPSGLAAAVTNAIDDAIGVRLTALPVTPAAVRQAWRAIVGPPSGGA